MLQKWAGLEYARLLTFIRHTTIATTGCLQERNRVWCAVGSATGSRALRLEDTRRHTRHGRYAEWADADNGSRPIKSSHLPP